MCPIQHILLEFFNQAQVCTLHTVRKSRNMNKKRIKILHGCPFESCPNWAQPIQSISQFLLKRLGWPCLVRSALKRTPVQNFNHFSIMFNYIFSTTYQRIKDLFYSVIFLDFRTVWLMNAVCVPARRFSTSKFEQFRNCNRIRFYFLTIT